MAEHEHELTPEQLMEAIRRMKVSDVLVSTVATVGQLGYAKLEAQSRDLDQARLAIEALRALTPVLEGHVAAETIRDFNQLVANLQLAYVSAVSEAPAAERAPPGPADEAEGPVPEPPPAADAPGGESGGSDVADTMPAEEDEQPGDG